MRITIVSVPTVRGVELPDNDDMNQIFRTIAIVGLHNPIDTTIAGSVWKTAAEDGEFIGVQVLVATIAVGLSSTICFGPSLMAGKVWT